MYEITINADDFGLNESCTKAICQAFAEGLITDTTMVANGDAFAEAIVQIQRCRLHDKIGIHFNLTEGRPLTEKISALPTFAEKSCFHGKINRYKRLNKQERAAVYGELSAQIEKLEKAGVKVNHADSHHHIHTAPFIAPIVFRVCKEHGIRKIRLHRNIGTIARYKMLMKKIYNKKLHKQFVSTDYFGSIDDAKTELPDGVIEIMVHPDYDKNGNLIDRKGEECTGALLSNISKIIEGKTLISYKEL